MLLAQRILTVGRGDVAEGDVIKDHLGRSWGPLLSTAAVVELSDNAINSVLREAMPFDEAANPEGGVLRGSDIQPAMVNTDPGHYSLGDLVSTAFQSSGLSLIAWNALPDSTRETLIWAESVLDGDDIPILAAYDADAAPAGPGDPPEGPHMLFDPKRHFLKYRGAVVGYWIVEGDDANVAQIDKAEYQRLKVCEKSGASAYVELTEREGEEPGAGESGDQAAAA
jgi:hypothetical protein